MNCIWCLKEITDMSKCKLLVLDGKFIHSACVPLLEEQCAKIDIILLVTMLISIFLMIYLKKKVTI